MRSSLQRFVLSVFFLIPLSNSFAIDETKNPWKGTGLQLSDFIDREVKDCYLDDLHFLGCIEALNVLGAAQKAPLLFTDKKSVKLFKSTGHAVETFPNGLSAYSLKPGAVEKEKEKIKAIDPDDKEALQKVLNDYLKQEKKIKTIYMARMRELASVEPHLDFKSLFQKYSTQLSDAAKADEETVAAEVYNKYLEISRDPHTSLVPASFFAELEKAPDEEYGGVGMQNQLKNGKLMVTFVKEGGPAAKGGLHIGDELLTINGKATQGQSDETIVSWVRGPKDTSVSFDILRDGKKLSLTFTREIITAKNVETRIIESSGNSYGYIELNSFMDLHAGEKIADALDQFAAKKVKGIILDLRNNGGGELGVATMIASLFLNHRVVFKVLNLKTNEMSQEEGEYYHQDETTPMVTLINGSSASASELIAGAFQDHQRSWIVGDRSFGKATVQITDPFTTEHSTDKLLFKHTVARFYQPLGRTNQLVGIIPDFYVDPIPNATDVDRYTQREEDLYSALPALGAPWVEPRAKEVDAINDCRKAKGKADALYQSETKAKLSLPDYRLLVALDILNCL